MRELGYKSKLCTKSRFQPRQCNISVGQPRHEVRRFRHVSNFCTKSRLALAYGTRVEDAQDRRIAPGNLRAPPKALAPNHRDPRSRPARTVSVIRHGIDWLRRLLLKGRLWSRVWLLPEPWPEPKLNLEITRHVPP